MLLVRAQKILALLLTLTRFSFLHSTRVHSLYPIYCYSKNEVVFQEPPIVKTETVKYDPSSFSSTVAPKATSSYPFVPTESRTVGSVDEATPSSHEADVKGSPVVTTLMEQHGEIITTQNITSKTRTVETVTVRNHFNSLISLPRICKQLVLSIKKY